MEISAWLRWMMIASLAGEVVLLIKLALTALTRVYRWFTWMLLYDALLTLLLLAALGNRLDYARIWYYTQPVSWILWFGALLEIYSLVMGGYQSIAGLLRWAVILASAVSFLLVLSHSLDLESPRYYFHFLRSVVPLRDMITCILAISMLMPWVFVTWFPVRLRRNVVVHALLFTILAGAEAVALLARRLHSAWQQPVEGVALVVGNLCFAAWIIFLGARGEQVEIVAGPRRSQESERRLLTQLMSFEQSLSRAASGSR